MVQKDVCSPQILRGLGVFKENTLLKSAHKYLDHKGDDESSWPFPTPAPYSIPPYPGCPPGAFSILPYVPVRPSLIDFGAIGSSGIAFQCDFKEFFPD